MSEFVSADSMSNYRDILNELLGLDAGLTDWEVEFVESLSKWDGAFTQKQAEQLERVYERRC